MQLLNYRLIEKKLGIKFKNKIFLKRALTHASHLPHKQYKSNETLEFLGDAVLELLTREYLLKKFPKAREGELSNYKKLYTSAETLYQVGKEIELGKFLIMDKGEELTGGRDRPSNIANGLEAIIGALYLDRGLMYTRRFLNRIILRRKIFGQKDYKSILNQYIMRNRYTMYYRVTKTEGPPHHRTFFVDLYINKKRVSRGSGDSRKKAEQTAAKIFLEHNPDIKVIQDNQKSS